MILLRLPLLALLTAQTVGQKPVQLYNLREDRKVGISNTYETSVDAMFDGSTLMMRSKSRFTIKRVGAEGDYDLEETLISGRLELDGTEEDLGFSGSRLHRYDKDGREVKEERVQNAPEPMPNFLMIVQGYDLKERISVGHNWEYKGKDSKSKFEFIAVEKAGSKELLKISCKTILSGFLIGGEASATIWLNASDASVEKIELQTDSMTLDETKETAKVRITVIRQNEVTK